MELNESKAIDLLNQIIELELAGAVRYTQYSLMVFGHARIPIMHWMRQQASEALLHATEAGEEVTALGARVSLGIAELAGTHHASVDDILQELVVHERRGATTTNWWSLSHDIREHVFSSVDCRTRRNLDSPARFSCAPAGVTAKTPGS